MKAAPFALAVPAGLGEALDLLDETSRPLAGGQSLGPMLNLRVAAPERLVPLRHLPELAGVEETPEAVTLGAAVTHAAIEDGLVPDIGRNVLQRVAANIAYRAVRNRGTIGGSLCHADPAADWPTVLLALDASVLTAGGEGARRIPLEHFFAGAYRTVLRPGEILRAVRIPRLPPGAGWGYFKACRKPGEFAHAMAAVRRAASGPARVTIGALGAPPLLLLAESCEAALQALDAAQPGVPAVTRQLRRVALQRAFALALS